MPKIISVFHGKKVVSIDCGYLTNKLYEDGIHVIEKGGGMYYVKIENGVPKSLSRKEIAKIMKGGS